MAMVQPQSLQVLVAVDRWAIQKLQSNLLHC